MTGPAETPAMPKKAQWHIPELVDLDLDMRNVENGTNPGVDGAGPFATSLS